MIRLPRIIGYLLLSPFIVLATVFLFVFASWYGFKRFDDDMEANRGEGRE
jgi:hypothetical protein